ncbi:hypothetical protein TorRG33x02_138460, partial [Trema orientale]
TANYILLGSKFFDYGRMPVERWSKISTGDFDPGRKCSTGVEIFRPPVEKRSEQLGEVAELVQPRSKFFDPSRAEASPSGSDRDWWWWLK